jgi:hypothetical protein
MTQLDRSRIRNFSLAVATTIGIAAGLSVPMAAADDAGDAPIVLPEQPGPTVRGFFSGEKEKDVALDLSGIACRPPAPNGALECLVVNDEGLTAQSVVVDRGQLTPGVRKKLIETDPPQGVRGSRPDIECTSKGSGKFKEFDGEGVAVAPGPAGGDGFFYVVGSHGCSRKKDEFKAASFLLARVPINAAGILGDAELTWRVSEALRQTPPSINSKIGKSLEKRDGLNIEGVAAIGDRLLFGLRAPSIDRKGFVVSVPVAELFATGDGEAVSRPVVHELPLGKDVGIRDLAALPDGKLLVLSGPTLDDRGVPYALSAYDPGASELRWLGRLADISSGNDRAKAEAVVVLGRDDKTLRVLVLFDGLQNGGPQEYRLQY